MQLNLNYSLQSKLFLKELTANSLEAITPWTTAQIRVHITDFLSRYDLSKPMDLISLLRGWTDFKQEILLENAQEPVVTFDYAESLAEIFKLEFDMAIKAADLLKMARV